MRVASKVENLPSNLGTLGLWVFELFAIYATDGRTKAKLIALFPTRSLAFVHPPMALIH